MSDRPAIAFEVKRDALEEHRIVELPPASEVPLADGDVLVRVDRFALTANNVTYAHVGESFGYWQFFPADPGWGRIPVWGFADVLRSARADLPAGDRLFGYFPMATHHVMQPASVTSDTVIEGAAHRRPLPAFYQRYARTSNDPLYERGTEDLQMLFRPLFLTAFLIDDLLASENLFGARAVVLTSASSKTALALASLLSEQHRAPGGVIGLTAAANVRFVESLGSYDRVVPYEELASLPSDVPIAIVDMAGNPQVLSALHRKFGDVVRYSCLVGITHGDGLQPPPDLPGAEPKFFFAPDHATKRASDWGPQVLAERMAEAWRRFVVGSGRSLTVTRGSGPDDVLHAYRDTLAGRARPETGIVLSLS